MMLFPRMRGAVGGVAALVVMGMPAAAWATLVLALDWPELAQQSDQVVVAEVVNVHAAWDARHEQILTTVDLQVAETWKGPAVVGSTISLLQPGGIVGDLEQHVFGMPAFAAGDRAVLFLRGTGSAGLAVLGLGQGKRPLAFDQATQAWVALGGDRSAAVIPRAGRLVPAPPEPALPLHELRARVQALPGGVPGVGTKSTAGSR